MRMPLQPDYALMNDGDPKISASHLKTLGELVSTLAAGEQKDGLLRCLEGLSAQGQARLGVHKRTLELLEEARSAMDKMRRELIDARFELQNAQAENKKLGAELEKLRPLGKGTG